MTLKYKETYIKHLMSIHMRSASAGGMKPFEEIQNNVSEMMISANVYQRSQTTVQSNEQISHTDRYSSKEERSYTDWYYKQ